MPKIKNGKEYLTEQEEAFCRAFARSYNRTEAAVEAGYGKKKDGSVSEKSASQQGWRLYNHPLIKARIDEIMSHAADEAGATKFFITSKLKEVVERSLADVKPILEFGPSGKLEETGEYRFDSKGANAALSTLADIQGMKRETRELDIGGRVEIIDDIKGGGDDGGKA